MASCRNCIHSGFCYLTIRDEGSPCEFVDKRNLVEVVRCKDCLWAVTPYGDEGVREDND